MATRWQHGTLPTLVALLVAVLLPFVNGKIQCMDHAGKPVDWFIVYKLPELKESPNPLIQSGFGHFYMDVNRPVWDLSPVSMNTTGHAVYYTLQQIYDNANSQDVMHVFHNDEKPDGDWTEKFGHTKGDVCFDKKSGFWLVHSLPRFPPVGQYGYPPSGREYGQTFLCMSLSYDQLDEIGRQMLYTYPWVYGYNFPSAFKSDNPNMAAVVEQKHVTSPPWNNSVKLSTLKGQTFISLAKFTKFEADLYSEFVAPFLQTDLQTETWQNGEGDIKSYCEPGRFKVENIIALSFPKQVSFPDTKDHSKWAVSSDQKDWTCIGDINRQYGQFKRGGGTMCFEIASVYKAFANLVTDVEKCP